MSYQQGNYHTPGYGTIYPPPPVYPSAPPQPSPTPPYGYLYPGYQGYPPPPPQYPHCDHHHHHHHHHHDGGSGCSSFLQGCFPPSFHPFSCLSDRRYVYSRAFPFSILSAISKTPISTRSVLENNASDSVVAKVVDADRLLAIKKRASEISSDLKGTSIFLIGMTSSYKSILGVILADALRYYYFDSDSLVEEAAGGKGAAISLVESDEEGYLASETEVLKQLSSMGRLIVCAGNGAVKSSLNLALLRHGISIWIDVPLDLVAREIMEDRIQLSASDTTICKSSNEILDQLTTLYDSGRSGFSTADATISLEKLASELGYDELNEVTVEDMCMEVLKEIERLVRVKKMMEEAARPF